MSEGHPYERLLPETVLAAVEAQGLATDGHLQALNSFENRVYQLGLEDGSFVVAKFYRPGRWSDAQIAEEHAFVRELVAAELGVVAPLADAGGSTLFHHDGFRLAVFPRRGGRAPELEGLAVAQWLGRTLGRLHAVGAARRFVHRARLDVDELVRAPSRAVLASALLPAGVARRYAAVADAAARSLDAAWTAVSPATLRLHGDCHPGNVLWTDAGPTFVDFDDARTGPAVQDIWMLLTGGAAQREALLDGYEQFRVFDRAELALVEPLRLMRQVHYAGWIASRWDDPAFPAAFPHAGQARWWDEHVDDLERAVDALDARR
jgi:Ser/Thr protein kinase RdoA (MazF antagonist)